MTTVSDDLWRLAITHDVPASKDVILARATICRTVHTLADSAMLVLMVEEHRPAEFSFTVRAPQDVREGLSVVASALPTSDEWIVSWWRVKP